MTAPLQAQLYAAVQRDVAAWNDRHPVGSLVFVTRDDGTVQLTRTRSKAQDLHGTAVIWLDGIIGCYRLDRVRPVVVIGAVGAGCDLCGNDVAINSTYIPGEGDGLDDCAWVAMEGDDAWCLACGAHHTVNADGEHAWLVCTEVGPERPSPIKLGRLEPVTVDDTLVGWVETGRAS